MVVTIRIDGYDVKRVLVDQGSGTKIMYPNLYKGLNLKPKDLETGAKSGGVERGHLPPLTCPIYIYIYIYFMCVVVKGEDLIEIVINSA